MREYTETLGGVKYVFMNIDGSVFLQACYHFEEEHTNRIDYSKSWFRPHNNNQPTYQRSDVNDEPKLPWGLSRRAVAHFVDQVGFKRWENR